MLPAPKAYVGWASKRTRARVKRAVEGLKDGILAGCSVYCLSRACGRDSRSSEGCLENGEGDQWELTEYVVVAK